MNHIRIVGIDTTNQKNVQIDVKLNYCDKNVKISGFDDFLVFDTDVSPIPFDLCFKFTQTIEFEFEIMAGSPIFCGNLGFIGRV